MTLCMDCNVNEAEHIIYDDWGRWLLVCADCIRETDMVCEFSIERIAKGYYE